MCQEEDVSVDETITVTIADLAERLDEMMERITGNETRVVIERDGTPVAALIPAREMAWLARFEEQQAEREALLTRLGEPFKDIPPEQIEAEVAEVVAEVRAEMEAERTQIAAER
jgi:PHD/YefM family antitoxin component YafN of YafNO toxin-antitoxin module